jgi:hypothetical protein
MSLIVILLSMQSVTTTTSAQEAITLDGKVTQKGCETVHFTEVYFGCLCRQCISMAEFSSKVTVARPKSPSLRTTIPEAVVKMMELKAGDEIVWKVKPSAKGVEVSLSKP